jgi:hypothetical protein
MRLNLSRLVGVRVFMLAPRSLHNSLNHGVLTITLACAWLLTGGPAKAQEVRDYSIQHPIANALTSVGNLPGPRRLPDLVVVRPQWQLDGQGVGSSLAIEFSTAGPSPSSDTTQERPQAIEHSDAYYKRLAVHRIASYTMLPIFATEYVLGQKLLSDNAVPRWVKPAHGVAAGAVATLFGINTVTGVWNLWESRAEPEGRARRLVHALLLLTSDAGFVYTGTLAGRARRSNSGATLHKNVAIASMSVATVGALIMWVWK